MRRRTFFAAAAATGAAAGAAGCATGDPAVDTSATAPGATASGSGTPSGADGSPTPDPTEPSWVQQENERPGSSAWKLAHLAPDTALTGYADAVSVLPGTPVALKVRAGAEWSVSAHRIGWYAGTGGRQVWASTTMPATAQPAPTTDALRTVSAAAWKTTLTVDTTGWLPGSYLFKLTLANGAGHYVPLTVRTASNAGRLVMVAATNTYQAYNTWGGYSLYKGPRASDPRAYAVSFERPYDQDGARFALGYEAPFVRQAEKLGINLGYSTSHDLNRDATTLHGATGVVSQGHDEYWTLPMREVFEAARDAGTNIAFLGANALYWRVRLEQEGRLLVCYKADAPTLDPVKGAQSTGLWRWYRSEAALTGMQYECFPAEGGLVVQEPDFFLFEGTGARKGSRYPGLIGVEIDRAYPAGVSPATTQVVTHSPVRCADVGMTYADMTYYTAASGAGVVDVGTMNWHMGVSFDGTVPTGFTAQSVAFATTVTRNLFTAMAAGPMGRAHPSRPNLHEIKPSASTRTGTGGSSDH